MLLKDGGSVFVESLKFRDSWYLVKSINLKHSKYGKEAQNIKEFYKEEVQLILF